jgi:hypothetical protein
MTNKKPKPKKMWAVYDPSGEPIAISRVMKGAICIACECLETTTPVLLEEWGYTVEKVTVTKGWGK